VAVLVGGCAADDTSGTPAPPVASVPATTAPEPTTSTAPPAVLPEGFDLAPAEVTLANGDVCALCLWVAETSAQRQRGLMGVTDLGVADGMVFVYDAPAGGRFWMRHTPLPLSIAFFADDGRFVSEADMEPCLNGPAAQCPRYAAAGPYVAAIEVPQGRLAELGIGARSRLTLFTGAGCDDAGP
jgi:uncharacterized protein